MERNSILNNLKKMEIEAKCLFATEQAIQKKLYNEYDTNLEKEFNRIVMEEEKLLKKIQVQLEMLDIMDKYVVN